MHLCVAAAAAKSLQLCPTVRPHRRQPTRLPRPWDSPGKNTGVGCHFPLQCVKVKSESEVAQSCPTLSDPVDCSLPGSSAHGIFQARVLEWGATSFSEECWWTADKTMVLRGRASIAWEHTVWAPGTHRGRHPPIMQAYPDLYKAELEMVT